MTQTQALGLQTRGACMDMCQVLGDEFLPRRLSLATQPSAAPHARRHVLRVLRAWELETLSGTAELLISELVTNAIKASGNGRSPAPGQPHARPPAIAVSLARTGAGVVMEVWDPSPTPPVATRPDPMDEGGRGLVLVDALSRSWGYYRTGAGGKVVWCEIGAS